MDVWVVNKLAHEEVWEFKGVFDSLENAKAAVQKLTYEDRTWKATPKGAWSGLWEINHACMNELDIY